MNNLFKVIKNLYFKKMFLISLIVFILLSNYISVFSIDADNSEAIFLYDKGLLLGYDNDLMLNDYFTIEQLITVLVRLEGHENELQQYKNKYSFSDVETTKWSAPYFSIAKKYGIVNGNPDGSVCPQEIVKTERIVAFLLRILGYNDFEWEKVTDVAINKGLLDRVAVCSKQNLTRGTVAKIIYSTLESNTSSGEIYGEKIGYFETTAITSKNEPETSELLETKGYTAKDISKIVAPAVVYIETDICCGSGFIIDSSGLVVTNYHVIDNCKYAFIRLTNGNTHNVVYVVDYNKEKDIAILKVNATNLPTVKLADSISIENGDTIYTIGSPKSLENTISSGLISNKNRIINDLPYIQISAPISSGSSGGTLINEKAEVIGITSAAFSNAQNLNLAIPINQLNTLNQCLNLTFTEVYNIEHPKLSIKSYEIENNDTLENANIVDMESKINGDTCEIHITGSFSSYCDVDTYYVDAVYDNTFLFASIYLCPDTYNLISYTIVGLYDSNYNLLCYSLYDNKYPSIMSTWKNVKKGSYYIKILQFSDYKYLWDNQIYNLLIAEQKW